MIGVDTNVLLRFVLDDHDRQSPSATRFLNDDERVDDPALVCPVVLVEFVWTLGRQVGFDKPRILAILDALAGSRRIAFTDEALVRGCLDAWRTGCADFPDYLIAALNLQAGARTTVTFDKLAAREPGFSEIRT